MPANQRKEQKMGTQQEPVERRELTMAEIEAKYRPGLSKDEASGLLYAYGRKFLPSHPFSGRWVGASNFLLSIGHENGKKEKDADLRALARNIFVRHVIYEIDFDFAEPHNNGLWHSQIKEPEHIKRRTDALQNIMKFFTNTAHCQLMPGREEEKIKKFIGEALGKTDLLLQNGFDLKGLTNLAINSGNWNSIQPAALPQAYEFLRQLNGQSGKIDTGDLEWPLYEHVKGCHVNCKCDQSLAGPKHLRSRHYNLFLRDLDKIARLIRKLLPALQPQCGALAALTHKIENCVLATL